MKQTCYRLEKGEYLSVIPCADLPAKPAEGGRDYWQEIETATQDELAEWLKPQALDPLMVEDILNPEHSTMLDRGTGAVYIEFPTNLDDSRAAIAYLAILVSTNLIATIRRGEIPAMQILLEGLLHEDRLPLSRTIALLYYILDYFIDRNMLAALKLRDRIGALEKAFLEDPDEISLPMLTQLKQQIRVVTSIAEDQSDCVTGLMDIHSPELDFSGYESYIQDLASNAEHVLRRVDRLEQRTSDLERSVQLTMHNAYDKRLRILTVISAIFLPLTLITGFFGMNFTGMILLDSHYGFWLIMAFMVIFLLGTVWYFYRRGWFD